METPFDTVDVPAGAIDVSNFDKEISEATKAIQDLEQRIKETYVCVAKAAASKDTAVSDLKTKEAKTLEKTKDALGRGRDAAREKRRELLRKAGLLTKETWIHVTSEERYYRILPDGRSLGPAHKEEGYKAAKSAVSEDVDVETETVEGIRSVFGNVERIALADGRPYFNTYRASTLVPKRGSCRGVLKIIASLANGERKAGSFILGWHAAVAQGALVAGKPRLMGTMPVFQTAPGAGKDLYYKAVSQVLGPDNCRELEQADISSNFVDGLADKLYVVANEVVTSSNIFDGEVSGKLKIWATGSTIREEKKGLDVVRKTRCFNTVFFSNEDRPVRIDKGDRRYVVFSSPRTFFDGTGKIADPDVAGVIDEINRLEDHQARGVAAGPTPQLAAFAWLLLKLPKHRLVKPYEMFQTKAKDLIEEEFCSSLDEFVRDLREDGLEPVVKTWQTRNPKRRNDKGEEVGVQPYDRGELFEFVGGRLFVVPQRLHQLYVDWHRWSGHRDTVVKPRAFTTRMNTLFNGGGQVETPIGAWSRPRVLKGIVWNTVAFRVPGEEPAATVASLSDDADFLI
jgi:hypothetical protein